MYNIIQTMLNAVYIGVLVCVGFGLSCVVYSAAVTFFVAWRAERFERAVTKRWRRK